MIHFWSIRHTPRYSFWKNVNVFNEMALTGRYCAVPGIMIEFIKVFAAFGAKIKRPCKNTKRPILNCCQFTKIMRKVHRDTDICSPVKCFKNLSLCRRSLGKTSVKRGEITQVLLYKNVIIYIYWPQNMKCHITDQVKYGLQCSHYPNTVSQWMRWCLPRMRSCWYDFVTLLTSFVISGGCCVFPPLRCSCLTLSIRRSSRLVSSLSLGLQ